MTIGRDNTDERINRLRRETSGETDSNVVGYVEEGSGATTALKGREDEGGPYVQPVGERPLRSDRYNLYTEFTLTAETVFTTDAQRLNKFPNIDVREWRTASFQFIYTPGRQQITNPEVLPTILQFGRLVWRLDGSQNAQLDFYPEGVLDGALFNLGNFLERMRRVDAAGFVSPDLSTIPYSTVTSGPLIWEVAYDVDPYDFIRLPVVEYNPPVTSPVPNSTTQGVLTVFARRVR